MGTPPSWSPVTARPVWTCLRSGRRSLGWPYLGEVAQVIGAAVVGAVEDGHPAVLVAGDRQAGLDLLEVGAAVLGMAVSRRGEAVVGVGVGAVQRDRRQIPVQPGHLQTEH